MDRFCFVCNTKTKKYYPNLRGIMIKTSGMRTLLCNLIERFLNEVNSKRQVNDKSNVICVDCLGKFQSYDQMVSSVKDAENRLRDLLTKTEIDLSNKTNKSHSSKNRSISTAAAFPFKCDICSVAFVDDEIRRHMEIHVRNLQMNLFNMIFTVNILSILVE